MGPMLLQTMSSDDEEYQLGGIAIRAWSHDRVEFTIPSDTAGLQRILMLAAIFIGGSTLLLGFLAFVMVGQSGIGGLLCPGFFWLVSTAFCVGICFQNSWQSAPTTISITEDVISVDRNLPSGHQTASYPAEPDMVVEWFMQEAQTDGDVEPTWHIELVGSYWSLPFGFALTRDSQQELVRRLREHVGQTLRNRCPQCHTALRASEIHPSGRQSCGNCDWKSRGRQPVVIRTSQGNLVLPSLARGLIRVEAATPELLILKWGASASSWLVLLSMLLLVGSFLVCLVAGLVIPVQNNPQQAVDLMGSVWVAAIAIGLPIVVVMYWHRHYRQSITLTATQARKEIEIERNVGGFPVRQWLSFEEGGYVRSEMPMPVFAPNPRKILSPQADLAEDIVLVGGRGQPKIGLGRRLSRRERRWLTVVLNRFFGTPALCLSDGKSYPELCPQCGRPLVPNNVDTRSGAIHCVGLPGCVWNSALEGEPILREYLVENQQHWNEMTESWKQRFRSWRQFGSAEESDAREA